MPFQGRPGARLSRPQHVLDGDDARSDKQSFAPSRRSQPVLAGALALAAAMLAGGPADAARAQAQKPKKPNIVVIQTDDQARNSVIPRGDAAPVREADRRGNHVHRLRRHDAALLPVAGDAADRPVRPQQRGPAQLLPRPEAEAERPARLAAAQRLHDRARRQVPERLRAGRRRPGRRRARLGQVVHAAREAPLLQLEGVEERQDPPLRHPPTAPMRRRSSTATPRRWTKQLVKRDDPFYLQVDHYAPALVRRAATPAAARAPVPEAVDEGRFGDAELPRPPSFDEEDVSDKPAVHPEPTAAQRRGRGEHGAALPLRARIRLRDRPRDRPDLPRGRQRRRAEARRSSSSPPTTATSTASTGSRRASRSPTRRTCACR